MQKEITVRCPKCATRRTVFEHWKIVGCFNCGHHYIINPKNDKKQEDWIGVCRRMALMLSTREEW